MFVHRPQKAEIGLAIVPSVDERFKVARNNGQRGSQLVRNIRHKFFPNRLQRPDLADIVKYDQRSGQQLRITRTKIDGSNLEVFELELLSIADLGLQLSPLRFPSIE